MAGTWIAVLLLMKYGLVVHQKNSVYLLSLDGQLLTLSSDDYIYRVKKE